MNSTVQHRLDNISTSVAVKAPVDAVTIANITLTGTQTIDGIAVTTGDRVLVKDQTDPVENGIWIVDTSAWERAKDFDGNRDVVSGTLIVVKRSTADDVIYQVTTPNTIVIGTTALAFATIGETRGTWTPDLEFGGDSDGLTYALREGRYVKRGTLIYFEGHFELNNNGTSTGAATIAGLPFTSATAVPNGCIMIGRAENSAVASGFVEENDTFINLYGATGIAADEGDLNDTAELHFSGFYTVDP